MTEKQAQQLIESINALADAIYDIASIKGQMGYTIADSLEAIALEPHYKEIKEKKK
jgi:pilus assembly protein TadC